MIRENQKINELITKILEKYPAEGSNVNRKLSPFIQEALRLKKIAPFLEIDDYLFFLSEMSTLIIELNNGTYATFYGLDDWEEGLNVFDYPIPEENGFHLVADICNAEGEMIYFSYNSKEPKTDILWTSTNVEEGPYTKTDLAFADLLNSMYEGNY